MIDLLSLCPANAPHIQWLTYTNHTLPTVMIFIALAAEQQREQDKQIVRGGDGAKFGGVVSLINNVIIYGDDATRAWFAQYIKAMQHKVWLCVLVNVNSFSVHCIIDELGTVEPA